VGSAQTATPPRSPQRRSSRSSRREARLRRSSRSPPPPKSLILASWIFQQVRHDCPSASSPLSDVINRAPESHLRVCDRGPRRLLSRSSPASHSSLTPPTSCTTQAMVNPRKCPIHAEVLCSHASVQANPRGVSTTMAAQCPRSNRAPASRGISVHLLPYPYNTRTCPQMSAAFLESLEGLRRQRILEPYAPLEAPRSVLNLQSGIRTP
jgi:hypothetical protein